MRVHPYIGILSLAITANVMLAEGPVDESTRPHVLEEAAHVASELERMELPYQMVFSTTPVVEELIDCLQRLDEYLHENIDDLEGAVLGARLERLTIRAPKRTDKPNMSGPHQRLDRMLASSPNHAAAHHWKSRLHGELQMISEDPLAFEPENLNAALDYASRAVELEPDNAVFRENLALLLVENDEPGKALEALEVAVDSDDPLLGILSDFAALPLPPDAVPLLASRDALTIGGRDVPADRYARQRVKAYALRGPASEVERFYADQWGDFQLLDRTTHEWQGARSTSYRQWIARENGGWRVAVDETELPASESMIQRGLTVNVDETSGLPPALLSRIVPSSLIDDSSDQVVTVIRFIHHQLYLGGAEDAILTDDWVPSSPPQAENQENGENGS